MTHDPNTKPQTLPVVARIEDDGRVTHWRIVRTTRDPLGAIIEYEPALPTTRQDTHR